MRDGTGTFEIDPPDMDELAARAARLLAKGHPYLVAELAGDVAGFAYATSFRDRAAFSATLEDSIYVREGRRGQGVGRALLDALVRAAEAGGYRQMLALIGDSANAGSIALHEAAGFRPAGTLRATGWKFGRWLDVVVMQRSLGVGDKAPPTV